ncbi:MAG: single-stranded-DNA-specific exonuclease RecJ [Clostridiales bacterium]|jgi:single-stranded-DNA-specific exonuclease|nr:single-stranded-DNA-specific exonuclease RecJ [Clostridiales bacterium]
MARLGITQGEGVTRWVELITDADLDLMSATLGVSTITAKVLTNRGIRSRNAAIRFLRHDRQFMYDAALLCDMGKAVNIARKAVADRRKITVYGDYDVDGVTSSVILLKTLRRLGAASADYYIPAREAEGYGLNKDAVKRLAETGTGLLIACDNGISAVEELALANELGMETIVVDHHEPAFADGPTQRADILPPAGAVIDHKRADCSYPFKALCAAGLCYKLAVELSKACGSPLPQELDDELLSLAALATVCDIVPLLDENRVIVTNGLDILSRGSSNLGLRTLLVARNLAGRPLTVHDAGFIIGPCINAAGRLGSAATAADLLLAEDAKEAMLLAQRLINLNERRKAMTEAAAERIMETVSGAGFRGKSIYLVHDPQTPEGIAGIAAGRVKDALNHPAIVFTNAAEPGVIKGSARSVTGYNVFEGLFACRDILERLGGHAMAAGCSLRLEHLEELDRRLNASCGLTEADFDKTLYIDGWLRPENVTFALANELSSLGPFGKDCHEPLFAAQSVRCESAAQIGADGKTLRFTFSAGYYKIKGIAFGIYDDVKDILKKGPMIMDIAYNIGINDYNGERSLQLIVRDLKVLEPGA